MDFEKFSKEWESAFKVRAEILNASSVSEAERIFNQHPLHPLSLYGRLDFALDNKEIEVTKDCTSKVLRYVTSPLPNNYFRQPTNDPIGEIMLKPLIVFPLLSSPFNEPSTKPYTDWILTGFVYLFECYLQRGIKAVDSLRTMGKVLEQNNNDFAVLIFGYYLGIDDYANAYTKFLIFTFFYSAIGFKKHYGDMNEFNKLIKTGKDYINWHNERNPHKEIEQLLDEGQAIAKNLHNKVIDDINKGVIDVSELCPPNFKHPKQ